MGFNVVFILMIIILYNIRYCTLHAPYIKSVVFTHSSHSSDHVAITDVVNRQVRVTDLSLLKQCAAEMSQSEESTEAPQYRLPEKWRLTCHGHSPSSELTPPTIRSGPVDEATLPAEEGRPQAEEYTVMDFVIILVILYWTLVLL